MTFTSFILSAAAMGMVAHLAHAEQPQVNLESKTLAVAVDPTFPRIARYTHKADGSTIDGQSAIVTAVELNGASEPCRVTFTKRSEEIGEYQLSFNQSQIEVTLRVTVGDDAVEMRFTQVKENGKTKLKSLTFPGCVLLTASSTQAGAELAAVVASGYSNLKETIGSISTLPESDKPSTGNNVFLSNGKLAAGIIDNHLQDETRVAWQTKTINGAKTCSAWRPVWQYREIDTEALEMPWTKVIITADRNGDGKADWQDAGLVHRKLMARPFGSEFVRHDVADQIAMDFASLVQQPFLRILDEIKKSYLLTDGIGQRVTIKGFSAEGHDSANTDYCGHYNHRAGGLKDLNFLMANASRYNTRIGVHINATEVYPEAHRYNREILDLDANGNPKGGWAWLDASHLIDKRKDTLTGNLYQALDQMRKEMPKLDFIYLDVYGDSGWTGWKIASKINALGLPLGTEYSTALDPWTTWAHQPGFNSRIFRFLWSGDRDLFRDADPLLRGADHIGFMGWQGERDIQKYLTVTFGKNLPTKYLQHFDLLRWDAGKEAIFSDGVRVVKSGDTSTCTRDGRPIMTWTGNGSNNRLFVPWEPKSETKIYVWDEVGSEQTWELPPSWMGKTEVFLYRLSDQGRTAETKLPVINGRVTLQVPKSTPHVIYQNKAPTQQPLVWGEGGFVADPGFDSHQLSAWKPVPAGTKAESIHIENLDTGDSRLIISGASTVPTGVSQMINGLEAGKSYAASAWVRIKGNRKAVIQVTPQDTNKSSFNYVTRSNVRNRNDSDAKLGTFFQRLRVVFTLPAASTSVNLQLLAAPDNTGALVEFDDVRLVRTEIAPEASKHAYFEDFEHVDQGWGPFVYASPGQTQTHLSETNEGITNDTIQGKYSFKTLNEPAGMVVRSLPSFLRLKPATRYRITLDSIADSDLYHLVVQGRAGSPSSIRLDQPIPKGKGHLSENFVTGRGDETFVALMKRDKNGGMCVLDCIAIDDLGPAPAGSVKDDDDGNTLPGATLSEVDTFSQSLSNKWSVIASKHNGTSVAVANGKLTINATANVSALIERKLPANTVAVEATLSARGATGETWGPGVCLIWPGGQMLRVNLRGPENRFGIDSTVAPQKTAGSLIKDSDVTLRVRIKDDHILLETRNEEEDGDWQALSNFDRTLFPGNPSSIRVGKMHGVEGTNDHTDPGDVGICDIKQVKIFAK